MKDLIRIEKQFATLPEDPSEEIINNTARRLAGQNFTPTLLIDVPDFIHVKKRFILDEVKRIIGLSEEELADEGMTLPAEPNIFRMNHLKLLYYFYELLTRLRTDDADAWDEVNELYEDD